MILLCIVSEMFEEFDLAACDLWRHRVARGGVLDGAQHLCRRRFLEDVAVGAVHDRLENIVVIIKYRYHNDEHGGSAGFQPLMLSVPDFSGR